MLILIDFVDPKSPNTIELQFTPDSTKNSIVFILENQNKTLEIRISEKLDPEELETIQKQGKIMSMVNTFVGSFAEVANLVLSFLGLDASGSLMRLS